MKIEFHSFFDSVDEAARAELVKAAEHRIYGPGECIFEERSQPDALYLVISGEVEIRKRTPLGHVAVLSRIGPDDFFGEMGVLDGHGRSASAYSVEQCRLARIPADMLLHALETLPGSATVTLFKKISLRLRKSNQDHVKDAFQSERLRLLQSAGESLKRAMACGLNGTEATQLWLDAMLASVTEELVIEKEVVTVEDLFTDLKHCIGTCLLNHNIALSLVPCAGSVCVDRKRFMLALYNLVVNAVESMHGGVGTLAIEALWRPSEVELRIADSGCGIAEGDRDRIFSAFFTSGKGNALGLGLTTSKQIIEAHGGTIMLSGSGPEGTAFLVSVPTK